MFVKGYVVIEYFVGYVVLPKIWVKILVKM